MVPGRASDPVSRARGHLERVAHRVPEADGSALLLSARALTPGDGQRLVGGTAGARVEANRRSAAA